MYLHNFNASVKSSSSERHASREAILAHGLALNSEPTWLDHWRPHVQRFMTTLICGLAMTAQAQNFPNKPVTITTAFAAGSGPDAVLRQVADKPSKLWNQPVWVNNKPGGGGFIAMDSVQRLPADGYNLLQLDSEHLAAVPHLYKSKNFVTLNTFDPVATLFRTPFFIAVSADSKWQNVKDLIAEAKANSGKVSFGSWGIGSPGHLGGEEV